MTRFACVCPPFFSHIRLFEALGTELLRRGHEIHFIVNAGASSMFVKGGLGFPVHELGRRSRAELDRIVGRAAKGGGPLSILRTVADTARLTDDLCREGPTLLHDLGVEAVIGDQMEPASGLLAEFMDLPLISVASALPVHDDPTVPLPFLPWPYDPSEAGMKRNRGGEMVARKLLTRQRRTIAGWAARFGLPERDSLSACLSSRCQISQLVESFDFPRVPSPIRHRVGPIRSAVVQEGGSASIRRQPGRPLVFASFGTLQGHRFRLFKKIARACREIGADCVIAHCGGLSGGQAASLDARVVTDFLPQRVILKEADVCITHAGMNTVLDALEANVPMLAIPMAFDQPGIAARIAHHGVGLRLGRGQLSSRSIADRLARLLGEATFKESASVIGRDIRASGGVKLAAKIIEEATRSPAGRIKEGQPV